MVIRRSVIDGNYIRIPVGLFGNVLDSIVGIVWRISLKRVLTPLTGNKQLVLCFCPVNWMITFLSTGSL